MCNFVCVFVRACVRARVREGTCVRACVRACVSACVRDVFAIYDNNISPRLIMIIITIIILYFIQIRHTDDFPSTCTRIVIIMSTKCNVTRGVMFSKHFSIRYGNNAVCLM